MTDQDYDPEYKEMPMWDQLGKILDSEDNKIPKSTVITDDGDTIENISLKDAADIKIVLNLIEKPAVRKELLDKIQTTEGFKVILKYVRSAPNAFRNFN